MHRFGKRSSALHRYTSFPHEPLKSFFARVQKALQSFIYEDLSTTLLRPAREGKSYFAIHSDSGTSRLAKLSRACCASEPRRGRVTVKQATGRVDGEEKKSC